MRLRIVSFSLIALFLAAVPAVAQETTVYQNGAINGSTDAWTINFGFVVSDTFVVGPGGNTVNGLTFGAWTFPGDVLLKAEVQITSAEFGGTTYFDGVVSFTQFGCSANQYGFNVCSEAGTFPTINLAQGTYWLNLDNAVVNDGDPIYWDENSGPSSASENTVGTIPSESFTIVGGFPQTGSVPEPGSILLLGSGAMGVIALLRRKLS